MELRVLRYFYTVAREENITRAAQLLHVTQPTLSRQLMQLEKELGTVLFHRSSHRIALTEDGILLKRRAHEILELSEKTCREFQSREGLSGEIAIGCGETCNMAYLSDLMMSFRQRHPLVQFRIYSATADEVKDHMENGLLDMGLLMEPVEVRRYSYVPMPYRERWCALVRKDSPLAALPRVTPKLFAQVTVAARYNLVNNTAVMVHSGIGVALTLDKGFLPHPDLQQVSLSPGIESGAVLAWKNELPCSRTVESFISHVQNTPEV